MNSRQPKSSILTISDVFVSILGSEIYTICYFEKCCISVQPKNMEIEIWTIRKACKGAWGQKRFHFFGERNSYKSVVKRDFQKQTRLEKGAAGEGEGMKEVVR